MLAPALFGLLFARVLSAALSQAVAGVRVHYRTGGGFFDLRRLGSCTGMARAIVRDFLFVDGCALAAHSGVDLRGLAGCFAAAVASFGLTVGVRGTEVLGQLALGAARPPPGVALDGGALRNVDAFKCLGGGMGSAAGLGGGVLCRISRAGRAFGRLRTRVWHGRGVSIETRLGVCRAVVLPSLLCGCETWPCCRRHARRLDRFRLRCLRGVLRVGLRGRVPSREILRLAKLTGIEAMLNQARLRWSGHVTRMYDGRLPKQLFDAELSTGGRHKGGQRRRYRDVLKSTLGACGIPVDGWRALAQGRLAWRAAARGGTGHFEGGRLQSLDDGRSAGGGGVPSPGTAVPC